MPNERDKILQAAQQWVEAKRYDRAIVEYQRLLESAPNDTRTLLKIGDLQTKLRDFPGAIASYDHVAAYYASQGYALKAIAVLKQIRELIRKHAPDQAERYAHVVPKLAELYVQLGLTSDALAAYDEVATGLQRAGRDADAVEVFRHMVALDQHNPLPHLRLAEAWCRVPNVDAAIDSFWSAAQLLLQLERRDDARKVLERILHFRPDPAYARAIAQLFLERGTKEDGMQALQRLQIAFQADPKNLETLTLLAQSFTLIEQPEKALEVYKEMTRIAADHGDAELHGQLVAHLQATAPHDPFVRGLAALPAAAPVSLDDDSAVEILEDEEASDVSAPEVPIELSRPSRLPPPRAGQASAPEVVVGGHEPELAADFEAPRSTAFENNVHLRKALTDADSFRKLGLYTKAFEVLDIALELDPNSVAVRTKLRELLEESGDHDAALAEALQIATIHVGNGDFARAEALIYEVLEQYPEQSDALALLDHISGAGAGFAPGAPSASLPSFDLEEVGAADALSAHPPPLAMDMDAPFGVGSAAVGRQAPLPSFPLGPDDDLLAGLDPSEFDAPPPEAHPQAGAPDPFAGFDDSLDDLGDPSEFGPPLSQVEAAAAPPPAETHLEAGDLEEILDEAEFFAMRGLYDDARSILDDALQRSPHHPLLIERLQELDELQAGSGQSGTIGRGALGDYPQEPAPASDRAFDIAASLDALDELEPAASAPQRTSFSSSASEVDVDQVFAKFKEGVRAQVSESDSATHYDLGVAYKEMGLSNDAIAEFELAAQDPARECMCWAMVGMIQLELGQVQKSIDAYLRGLQAAQKTVDQEMSLYYDLGVAHELKQAPQEALYYFQKIARRDPGYRDVRHRIAALDPSAAPASQTTPNATGDDLDDVFDDLFETK